MKLLYANNGNVSDKYRITFTTSESDLTWIVFRSYVKKVLVRCSDGVVIIATGKLSHHVRNRELVKFENSGERYSIYRDCDAQVMFIQLNDKLLNDCDFAREFIKEVFVNEV